MPEQEIMNFSPWQSKNPPRKILLIRLQAMGDTIATLPYIQSLRNTLPKNIQIDFLTRKEVASIPQSVDLFDKVFVIGGGRSTKRQILYLAYLLPFLFFRNYDIIIDLQRNRVSRLARRLLKPKAWSEIERFSPSHGCEKYRLGIETLGLAKVFLDTRIKIKNENKSLDILKKNGWKEKHDLVVLNPAGLFTTRNWEPDNYLAFAKLWLEKYQVQTQFLVLGVQSISKKADYLKEKLGDKLINLVNLTSPVEAFSILKSVKLILSEDSGLMHMAWVQGVPTLAMFGSTRSDWSSPLGENTLCLNSSDLECGNCMLEKCKWGDVRCLTRYSPEFVFEKALNLLKNT